MLAKIVLVIVLSSLAACSAAPKCSKNQIQYLENEYARILNDRHKIERMESGAAISGVVYSSLSRADLINIYKSSYNRSVDMLVAQIKQCVQ